MLTKGNSGAVLQLVRNGGSREMVGKPGGGVPSLVPSHYSSVGLFPIPLINQSKLSILPLLRFHHSHTYIHTPILLPIDA